MKELHQKYKFLAMLGDDVTTIFIKHIDQLYKTFGFAFLR